jgi:hypothetical protein
MRFFLRQNIALDKIPFKFVNVQGKKMNFLNGGLYFFLPVDLLVFLNKIRDIWWVTQVAEEAGLLNL